MFANVIPLLERVWCLRAIKGVPSGNMYEVNIEIFVVNTKMLEIRVESLSDFPIT